MGKKKSGNRAQQQQNFQQLLADQTLRKFKPYIDEMIQTNIKGVAEAISARQSELVSTAFDRIRILEQILMEKYEDVNPENLANRVAELEDQKYGLVEVQEVNAGDVVRVSVRAKEEGKEYLAESSKLMVRKVGSGETLGAILEDALLGMKKGEVKEVTYGDTQKMVAELIVDRISSKPQTQNSEMVDAENEG